jgi:prepilin-type N-terminal cleavage/methylation domain-containing protein
VAGIPQYRLAARRAGFTLIELMIVVVIIGLLLGVAIPRVGTSITRDRVSRAAFVVQGVLDEATQIARRQGVPVTVTLQSSALRINLRSSGVALKSRTFGTASDIGATLALSPSGGITIFPTGRASAGLTVTITGGDATSTVTRSATGIIRRQ